MRIAIASYGQETSSFSPVPTTLETYELYGLFEGEQILEKCREVGAIGGFMQTFDAELEWTPVPIIHGWAGASGPLTAETLHHFAKKIADGLKAAGPLDAMYFALHGAAVADGVHDTEAYLLYIVRQVIGEEVPLVISLDHHANLTQAMVAQVDALVGHRTQPHDQYETGVLAGRLLLGILRKQLEPVMAWRKIPLITHQEQFLTAHGPMKAWFDLAREMETRPGVLSTSNFPMQPWLDVPEGGWATAVVTNGDQALAEELADELADRAWALREEFCRLDSISPQEAVRRAQEAEKGLVILSDTGDSVFGGATGDSTTILAELVRQEVSSLALVPMVDPETVEAAIAAGVGGTLTVMVGGKLDPNFGTPLELTAEVVAIGGGRFDVNMLGFESFDLGQAVLLAVGAIRILVTEKRGIGGNHPSVYEHFDIDLADAKMVVLKTASNWQFYQQWISEVIRVDTPGGTTSHLEELPWQHLPRPIYPLDEMAEE
ncbi:MAG: M81 family metallopeptidase [Gemmatimonadetes bacterium]|jgi:microcystin degradation protein MlrC|nr:M81 family metallopeptidase [Gemmatimonadota bacterium]MBT5452335.1 M81 family metallopeptidase [Gemmatimonadota bacterium]MBT5801988.1 M81 family metallopeptidase [Gemmatimonadota bacterium]MBT6622006.1 M81 family metallopeptidase [Gemmatimonadota bacterium]MBT6903459.1 M81 family metallopeptidase [Gemmatimonadota bacterium]